MSVRDEIEPALAANAALVEQVNRATAVLRDVIDGNDGDVSATWNLDKDQRGGPIVRLTLKYPPGLVERQFLPEDMNRQGDLRWSLGRMWGHLAIVRARRLLAEAREIAASDEGKP